MTAVVRAAVRRAALTSIIGLALTVGALLYAAGNLNINTDTAGMIDASLDWRVDFEAYRSSFPARDQNIVIVVGGPSSETSYAYARDLADALAREPETFPVAFLLGAGEFFDSNGLLYLSLDELDALVERLIEAQPLLARLADDVSGAGILALLRESIVQSEDVPDTLAADLDRVLADVGMTVEASRRGARRPMAWGELIGTEANVRDRQLIYVRPALDFNRVPAREAIDRIRAIGDELNERYGDDVELRLTGTLAMEYEELTSIVRSASATGFAALAMVVIVLFWALRSFVLLGIAVIVLLAGLSVTAAFAAVAVGDLNLLSVAFAVLYVGLGVDFILHMTLRVKELQAEGLVIDDALTETANGVGGSLVICAVTTAACFFAFMPTDFDGISELGLISGVGMIISLLVSLTLLPALLRLFWRGCIEPVRPRSMQLGSAARRVLPTNGVLFAAAAVALIALYYLPGWEFDGNPINLRDPDAESIRTLNELAEDSEAPVYSLAVIVSNAAAADQLAAELSALDSVASVQTLASLVPQNQQEKLLILDDLGLYLGSTLNSFGPPTGDTERLVAELQRLSEALATEQDDQSSRQVVLEQARAWLSLHASLDGPGAGDLARTLNEDLLGNVSSLVDRLNRGLDAQLFGRDDLPPELADRWLNDRGQELVEIIPRENLNDEAAAGRFVDEVRTLAPRATGLPVVYEEAAATVTRAFSFAIAYAFAIVSLLLLFFLRSLRDALLVLVPIAFAAIVTGGLSTLIGLPLNFANIIALPLLIGVGVDSGIHIVHRMRTEPPEGGNPLRTSTSRAVLMSALTTIASFGNLAFSSHVGMASMGQLLTIGMLMSLIAVLVVLPALLKATGRV